MNQLLSFLVLSEKPGILSQMEESLSCLNAERFTPKFIHGLKDLAEELKSEEISFGLIECSQDTEWLGKVLESIKKQRPFLPLLLCGCQPKSEILMQAIQSRVLDYFSFPCEPAELALKLEKAGRERELVKEISDLKKKVQILGGQGEILHESEVMVRFLSEMAPVAGSQSSVLIEGESGSGKELVARFIHQNSSRKAGIFLAVNCASIPESLAESELFGHKKGAFTGAEGSHEGYFLQADRGTLFLDEIGLLPKSVQGTLLRVLEDREVRPLGSKQSTPVNVRILAASNKPLIEMVREGTFREDLYYRLNVIRLNLPALRERGNDVLILARHFLENFAKREEREPPSLSPEVLSKLLAYPWPGNVRELKNIMERAVVLCDGEVIEVKHLPPEFIELDTELSEVHEAEIKQAEELLSLKELERVHILRVMKFHRFNRTLAAKSLGLDRKTLYRKLISFGFDKGTEVLN